MFHVSLLVTTEQQPIVDTETTKTEESSTHYRGSSNHKGRERKETKALQDSQKIMKQTAMK